jgi:hypothetical protein
VPLAIVHEVRARLAGESACGVLRACGLVQCNGRTGTCMTRHSVWPVGVLLG